MKISVIGSGYVGAVTAACFAELGNSVTCVDVVKEKVDMINRGQPPIYEPGLKEMMARSVKARRLWATTDLARAVRDSEVTFICVGTPSRESGETDLSYVRSAAREIGKAMRRKAFHVIVVKSTVPPGTSEEVARVIAEESGKRQGKGFGVCMNPEFLKEGSAVEDFMNPDRIVVGSAGEKERKIIAGLYSTFKVPLIRTDLRTAEMMKFREQRVPCDEDFLHKRGCEHLPEARD